ncbi:energy-coupling factor transporter transmembrane component T family protein [Agromyces soli]|uniref:Energy-coupling factor transporter transmembrane protein EcfT n=1 Tax=Agromyces soli TaxID=659012 RepID=A0ABY4APJ5_9MICO|nr:energy-coupling factor transporter transmembrane protein EcfT [Agromyces soli]UOE25076.1 energy-coupling factor transporter transmembrane protein EcfT [Agromyces soli]
MIGVFHPGGSLVHRAPALLKLGLLAALVTAIALQHSVLVLAGACLVVAGIVALARVPLRLLWRQLVPLLWLLAIAVPIQLLVAGWELAVTVALRLLLAVVLAGVYSLTTPVTETLDAAQTLLRPFRRWIDADRVGLALALAIRAIPLLGEIVAEVLDARRARGAEGSIRAVAVPVIVRALRTADHLGEALVARGLDD